MFTLLSHLCGKDRLLKLWCGNRTRKVKYLEENIGALKVVLTPEEEAVIREYCEKADKTEGRSPAGFDNMDYGDSAPLET